MSEDDLSFEPSSSASMEDISIDSWEDVSKAKAREELNRQVEEFLANGGKINYIDSNVLADPPRKPSSNYGSQPI